MSNVSQTLATTVKRVTSLRLRYKFLLIATIAVLVFLLSKGPSPDQNHFVYLSDSFLHGRLGLTGGGLDLAEVVPFNGNYYVVYPPMPAVLLLPFVAVWGTAFDQALLSVVLAGFCVAAIWLMLKKAGSNQTKALWLAALFGFGTCFWFIASVGSSWYIEHVVAVLFLTSAIILALYGKSNFAVGLILGCAVIARLPVALSFPFFLLLIYDQKNMWMPRFRQALFFFGGLAIPVGLNALYDYARYGVFTNIGYYLIPGIQEDPFFQQGIFNISYIPRHIYAIFLQGPNILPDFPWFQPNWIGMGLFLTTPAFLFIFIGAFRGGWRSLNKKAALAILCILPPIITHGTVGFTQFGYRFSLDFVPFLMLLTAAGMRENLGWIEKVLIVLSLLINLWGVVAIIKFGFVSF